MVSTSLLLELKLFTFRVGDDYQQENNNTIDYHYGWMVKTCGDYSYLVNIQAFCVTFYGYLVRIQAIDQEASVVVTSVSVTAI
ncbi:hypothetical protein RRG08_013772 [Elysia crispata]|uniref:Uncharacterized protein n=1 Tax=Elysia crispata TaxID=231223 RepID=A0AAE1A4H0_9GAST|nr:hypothetical protein RRG08_013772 [Elysia crispata]